MNRLLACFTSAFALFCAAHGLAAKDAATPPATPAKKPVLKLDPTPVTEGNAPVLVSYADVVEPVQKAVVSVASSKNIRRRAPVMPFPWAPQPEGEYKQQGMGSGVIITADGYVLTNNHVVEGADELTVILSDDREFKATIVGTDPKTDVAVIKIDAENLPIVTIADSDRVRVGDIVFAVGNPLDIGQTVTMGIVSATSRRVGILDEIQGYENFIQTDAAINQGNSGGALIDAKGRLIGINSAILSPTRGNIGIGFAIPTNLARSILESLIESGKVTRGFLGVSVDDLTPELAESLNLKKDQRGVVVKELSSSNGPGPAERAGVERYDVITSINGKKISSTQELRLIVAQLAPDSDAEVKVFRDGKERSIKVKLGRQEALADNELLPGVRVARLTAEQRRKLDLDARVDGLVITEIAEESPYQNRLAEGMVIIAIQREVVSEIDAAKRLLVPGRNLLTVYYRGSVRLIPILIQ
jgi:Do/DeqQ family serine protease